MKHLKDLKLNENLEPMTINEFTSVFTEFTEFIMEKFDKMDDQTQENIRESWPFLIKAWRNETQIHTGGDDNSQTWKRLTDFLFKIN